MGQQSSSNVRMFQVEDTASNDEQRTPVNAELPQPSDRDDFVNLLHSLVGSGVINIVNYSDGYSDRSSARPKVPQMEPNYKPDTRILDKSEIKLLTEQSSGALKKRGVKRCNNNVLSMIMKRQKGYAGFTKGEKCYLNNEYLPNRVVHKVGQYNGKVFTSTFSKAGDRLLIGSQDKKLRLYDTSTSNYRLIQKVKGLNVGWSILDTAFNPDGNIFAYSSWSPAVHIGTINADGQVTQHAIHLAASNREQRFCLFSVAISHDSSEILVGDNEGLFYTHVIDHKKRGHVGKVVRGHEDDLNFVCFADESSNILYSGGDDGLCKVWDRRVLKDMNSPPVGVLAGHQDGITYIDPKGDGRHLISNSKDQTIKLWDVRKFSSKTAENNTRKAVTNQNWDYRQENVPERFSDKTLLPGDSSVMTYRGHLVLQTLIRSRFSPSHTTGQRFIYSGCAAGRVVVYDVLTGKIQCVLNGHNGCVRDVAWHPYRGELVSSSWDQSVMQWRYSSQPPEEIVVSEQDADRQLLSSLTPRRSRVLTRQPVFSFFNEYDSSDISDGG